MAAVESMTRYSNRFKAPPYLSCFRCRPMQGACTPTAVAISVASRGFLIDTALRKDGAANLSEPEHPKEGWLLIGHSQPRTIVADPGARAPCLPALVSSV